MRHTPCGCNLVQELPNVYKLVRLYCLPLRGRHAEVVVPYDHGTHPHRRARPLGAPVQELPSAYKLVRLYRLPLRGRRGHVPALQPWNVASP